MDDKSYDTAPELQTDASPAEIAQAHQPPVHPALSALSLSRWEAYGYEAITYLTLTPAEAAAGMAAPLTFYDAGGRPYTLTVLIPPGTCHGQRLLLAGAGGPARRGPGRGDLTVVVRVSEQAIAERPALSAAQAPRPLPRKMAVALLVTAALLVIALVGIALTLGILFQLAYQA
jgi:hypothetical protein